MKKVEKVSIGRYAFVLEEDAFKMTQNYIDELERYYSDKEGGSEIMEGIEERMAELFLEKCGAEGVVSISVVEHVISILGKPETIEGETAQDGSGKFQYDTKRKLYRDGSHKVLGGVCSGMAAYFNMDLSLMRILWVILFFCCSTIGFISVPWFGAWFVPVVYIILWIVLPQAKTIQQRCEMRGEKGNLDDIEKTIERGARVVEDRAKEIGRSDFWRVLGRVICIVIGMLFIIIGAAGLIAGAIAFFFGMEYWDVNVINTWFEWVSDYSTTLTTAIPIIWAKITIMLVYFLPFLGILYGGIQMTFGFKSPKWRPGLIIFILWLIAVIALCIFCSAGIFLM
ncbi:MAG: PspC domain-containing protein [Bacteroidales bacterium]|nr:PspC domain-containing protein [Bacteroidales bacterium]MDD4670584.1 PspC domain-containing protein [Bacteroidales bacterium]